MTHFDFLQCIDLGLYTTAIAIQLLIFGLKIQ
jgi:hypothetical protein